MMHILGVSFSCLILIALLVQSFPSAVCHGHGLNVFFSRSRLLGFFSFHPPRARELLFFSLALRLWTHMTADLCLSRLFLIFFTLLSDNQHFFHRDFSFFLFPLLGEALGCNPLMVTGVLFDPPRVFASLFGRQ